MLKMQKKLRTNNIKTKLRNMLRMRKRRTKGEITIPSYKKLFNIPEEYYKENAFLRSIKINYLKYHNLTDKQIETFKKVAAK